MYVHVASSNRYKQFYNVCVTYTAIAICPTLSICSCYLFPSVVIPSIENLTSIRQERINTFICQAVGEPVPDISWYFNDVMINVSDNSSKYMIVSRSLNITTTENTLTVYNVTSSDVGTYTCNASNVIGSVTSMGKKDYYFVCTEIFNMK